MPRNIKKWVREVDLVAQEFGFQVVGMTNNGHMRLRREGMREVITSSSPSDKTRTVRNVRTELRRVVREAGGDQA